LVSSKDEELGQFTVYAPHLIAQSSVMEMKLVSTETRYVVECTAPVLREVVRYIISHKTKHPPLIQKPLISKVMKDVCACKWDAWFIDEVGDNRQLLYDVILLANALNIQGLLHLACAKVASLIKGQPLANIQNILNPTTTTTTTTTTPTSTTTSPTTASTNSSEASPNDESSETTTEDSTSPSNATPAKKVDPAEDSSPKCTCPYH